MKTKIGSRVIAVYESKDNVLSYFGREVYAGDFDLPPNVGGFNFGQKNPRIDLDNGQTVWGCECWWGSEKAVEKQFPSDQWNWKLVDIEEIRK